MAPKTSIPFEDPVQGSNYHIIKGDIKKKQSVISSQLTTLNKVMTNLKKSPSQASDKSPARSSPSTANKVSFNENNCQKNENVNLLKGYIRNSNLPNDGEERCAQMKGQTQTVLFNLDTGFSHSLIPIKVAETFHLKVEKIIDKSVIIRDIQGKRLHVLGKAYAEVTLTGTDKILKLDAYVTEGLKKDEVMIGLSTLLNWQLLPPTGRRRY